MRGLITFLPLILLVVIMYFLLIRPQKRRERETAAMRSSVRVGDEIITIGGICGKIVKTKEESLIIQVGADKVKFEIMRWAVSKVVTTSSAPRTESNLDDEDDSDEGAVKKGLPKRMKKAAPVEEEADEAPAEEADEAPAEEEDEVPAEEAVEEDEK